MTYYRSLSISLFLLISCGTKQPSPNNNITSLKIVNYQTHIKPIYNNYCATCHHGKESYSEIDLSTYLTFRKETERGTLLKRIHNQQNPMPQKGLLPQKTRQIIEIWAKNGYLKSSLKNTDMKQPQAYKFGFLKSNVTPININEKGFDFFEKMQGNWIGKLELMGQKTPWFAFDYRAISPSHVFGIYEGGTVGNLFTSFFVTEFNGVKTIMARNGGILAGIYRTSYFVLDKVKINQNKSLYRFVDAYGDKDIMWIDIIFEHNDTLFFTSYTSRFGTHPKPSKHMEFNAIKMFDDQAKSIATKLNYPQNKIDFNFSNGLVKPYWQDYNYVTSASYIWKDEGQSLKDLAKLSKDPYTYDILPNLGQLTIHFNRDTLKIKDKNVLLYLSQKQLVNENKQLDTSGSYLKMNLQNSIQHFPEIKKGESSFTFYYLHPGNYYLTAIIDTDENGYANKEDIVFNTQYISLHPKQKLTLNLE